MTALALLFLLASQVQSPGGTRTTGASVSACVVCHGKEGRQAGESIHSRAGIGCTACHGGDPTAMEVGAAHGEALVRLDEPRAVVQTCGGCHADVQRMRHFGLRTDALSLYATSRHGELLAQDPRAGVADCSSCHGAHDVLSTRDPRSPAHPLRQVETCGACHADLERMSRYGSHGGEVEAYRNSVHGRALIDEGRFAAPACTDCHGSHGAVPPRFDEVEDVCGQCHSVAKSHFDASPHARGGSGGASIECTSCHGNHAIARPSDAMFEGDQNGHCGACHLEGAGTGLAVAQELLSGIRGLESAIRSADADVRVAGERGLFLGAERRYLEDARGLLIGARSRTHALSPLDLEATLNQGHGMVGQTLAGLEAKERNLRDRKIFASAFALVSSVFALVLWLTARTIGGRWKPRRGLKRAEPSEGPSRA